MAEKKSWGENFSSVLGWFSAENEQQSFKHESSAADDLKLEFSGAALNPKEKLALEADLAERARKEAEAERAKRSRQLQSQQPVESLPCPGKMDELGRDIQDTLSPNVFEGVRFEYHKALSMSRDKNFSYGHMLWMGPDQLPKHGHYEFSTTLGLEKALLMSQLSCDGTLNGRYHHQWTPDLLTKISFVIAPDAKQHFNSAVGEVDWNYSDTSISLKLTHENIAVASYFQSVTPTIALGIEGIYHPGQEQMHTRYVAKYDNRKDLAVMSLMDMGTVSASYGRRVSERLLLASEFRFDSSSHESQAKIGYKWSLRQSQFKATVDSNGVVAASLEEMISPVLKLVLNGELSHFSNEYKFGIGATIG